MYGILLFIYIIVCVGLTIVILLQSSKGGGLAGAFGGGDSMGAVFGGRGAANFLSKMTTGFAVAFLALALLLSFVNRGSVDSTGLIQQEQQKRASEPGSGLPVVPTDEAVPGLLPIEPAAESSADSTE